MRFSTLLIVSVCFMVYGDQGMNICHQSFCLCRPSDHPSWTNVSCSLIERQRLEVHEGSLPESVTDLNMGGGKAVTFGRDSLTHLKDLRRIQIDSAKMVFFRRHAAYGLSVRHIFLEIMNTEVVEFETHAFGNLKGPVTGVISNCSQVTIQKEAFSWLLSLNIDNVKKLTIESGTFMIDSSAAIIGNHGPGMTIEISNTNIPELPKQAFGSSAAVVQLTGVSVDVVRNGAFGANTYNKISADDSSFGLIEEKAFSQKTLINTVEFKNCIISEMQPKAIVSAINYFNMENTSFTFIQTGSVNITVVAVKIENCRFSQVYARGFVFSSWNRIKMNNNRFDNMSPHAFITTVGSVHSFSFTNNIINKSSDGTFAFIGQAYAASRSDVKYEKNYYNEECKCTIANWFQTVLGISEKTFDYFAENSYCTVSDIFARCFNAPEKNLQVSKFIKQVCGDSTRIECEPFKLKNENGSATEIKNPLFPDKKKAESYGLSDRNKKVIGIIIVTILGCVIIALFISLIKWMIRKGYCFKIKNAIIASNASCVTMCRRIFSARNRVDNSRSISQMSVIEYTERHRLNEPRTQDFNQTLQTPPARLIEDNVITENKTTQTLPEELTKELLDSLREKLDDPENYVEAREMIEHLYELIKVEDNIAPTVALIKPEENIYELPFQNTTRRVGKNNKAMVSVGTRTPSLDRLLPLSPYNRQTALRHEYFEPKDFAVHLYAEILNNEKKNKLSAMPDVVGETAAPRGPYLKTVQNNRVLKVPPNSAATSPQRFPNASSLKTTPTTSTIMINRPLPEKPISLDPGEGPSKNNA